MLFVQLKH